MMPLTSSEMTLTDEQVDEIMYQIDNQFNLDEQYWVSHICEFHWDNKPKLFITIGNEAHFLGLIGEKSVNSKYKEYVMEGEDITEADHGYPACSKVVWICEEKRNQG